jgi:membrane protein implicated in regulation of membrane protease activity
MKIDRQDVLLVIGVAALVGGVAMWSRAAALVLFGLMCLAAVLLIERSSAVHERRIHATEKRRAS